MKRSSVLLCLILVSGGLAAVVLGWPDAEPNPPPAPPADAAPDVAPELPPPPYSDSPYLNTRPGTEFIGSAACATCHPVNHQSYLLTAHSKALCDVVPADEPPDAAFEHKESGRAYRVYRRDGRLRHEEVVRTPDGREVARTDLPLRYRVGSGHFTRTYLVEIDGFLHESPITWYASKGKWDMSPGYEGRWNPGFERPANLTCVTCHAGRVEWSAGADPRVAFREQAVGCESCHGPGALHQTFRAAGTRAPGEPDRTVVNPARLSRPLLESVCAACHLSADSSVAVRGRAVNDFRPGLPLTDVVIHYHAGSKDQMTVVGHVDQLRLSKCYQEKAPGRPELTCVTCHDPHARSKPADPVAFYRRKCLDCHETKPCAEPPAARLRRSPADDCTACHMPRGDTDIQHVAFTHHRIGRHAPAAAAPPGGVRELVPLDENPHLGALDRKRNLGIAYLEWRHDAAAEPWVREQAWSNLEEAYRGGARDADTVLALAGIAGRDRNPVRVAALMREVLRSSGQQPPAQAVALSAIAECERLNRNPAAAVPHLERAVRLRRFADDWRLLGASYWDEKRPEPALAALRKAIEIRPYRAATYFDLAECYRRLGDEARWRESLETAEWLKTHGYD